MDYIEYLKGFSIFTIVVMHYFSVFFSDSFIISKSLSLGGTGVHAFIFISGFGLAWSLLHKEKFSISAFYYKRFLKVYSPYIITVSLIFLLNIFIPVYDDGWYAYLGHVFLFKMFFESIIGSYGYHFWFLSTIIQCYMLFPLLFRMEAKMKVYFVVLCVVLSLSWSVYIVVIDKQEVRVWNSFCLQYIWEFVFGIFIARCMKNIRFRFWNLQVWKSALMAIVFSKHFCIVSNPI